MPEVDGANVEVVEATLPTNFFELGKKWKMQIMGTSQLVGFIANLHAFR